MSYSTRINLAIGIAWRFGLGFEVDRYGIHINLGPVWVAIEWL